MKHRPKKHHVAIAIIIIILALIISAFGTKIWLYANFLLGYDTVVKLQADKEYLFIQRGDAEQITFTSSVTANPFCSAACSSVFEDISSGTIMEQDEFSIRPGLPEKHTFSLSPQKLGVGIDLYRFTLTCTSTATFLCHTEGEKSSRSLVIPVERTLNDDEQASKQFQYELLSHYKTELELLKGTYEILQSIEQQFEIETDANATINVFEEKMIMLHNLWQQQDYQAMGQPLEDVDTIALESELIINDLNTTAAAKVREYNTNIQKIVQTAETLEKLRNTTLLNISRIHEINSTINQFNANNSIDVQSLNSAVQREVQQQSLRLMFDNAIAAEALCVANDTCIAHTSITDLADAKVNILNACAEIEFLNSRNITAASTHESLESAENAIQHVLRNNEIPNGTNSAILRQLREDKMTAAALKDIEKSDETTAAIAEYIPPPCIIPSINQTEVQTPNISLITIQAPQPANRTISFEDQPRICCIDNNCTACRNDPEHYPIIFLHGHAVNEKISADYSLEGFQKIQDRLEQDGWLSIGAISLYTSQNVPEGIFGLFDTPMTIRGSYYFDLFRAPDNYVVVQAKSESLDTYAVRLKELIDNVQFRTGKPKVRIIAFSMGGLVARRYIQVFGPNNVNKIILIGTPNKGIVDDVQSYCPVIGEELECRDMSADSIFMRKLNSQPPKVEIHNIVATGCIMGNGIGDGTVREERAYLDGARNYIINGTCRSTVFPLHLEIRDIDKYPKVYEIIKMALG